MVAAAGGVTPTLRYERGTAMLARVTAEVGALVQDEAAVERVRSELARSLAWRERSVSDDHDARYLHTARTIRILVADAACADAWVLTAAALLDTVDVALEPPEPAHDADVRALLASTPRPDGPEPLIEALLCAAPEAVVLAVAERLDQARHLHLRDDVEWLNFHRQVVEVYAPVALRAAPRIGHRLDRWADAFRRRLLRP